MSSIISAIFEKRETNLDRSYFSIFLLIKRPANMSRIQIPYWSIINGQRLSIKKRRSFNPTAFTIFKVWLLICGTT